MIVSALLVIALVLLLILGALLVSLFKLANDSSELADTNFRSLTVSREMLAESMDVINEMHIELQNYKALGTAGEIDQAFTAMENLAKVQADNINRLHNENEEINLYRQLGTVDELAALKDDVDDWKRLYKNMNARALRAERKLGKL